MKIKTHLITEEGLRLSGELPPAVMDVREAFFRFEEPIRYQLEATRMEGLAILVRGKLKVNVRAQCVRTLDWFNLEVNVEEFIFHEEQPSEELDLTPQIREDILLALPTNPVLPDTEAWTSPAKARKETGSGVWEQLDQLKIKQK